MTYFPRPHPASWTTATAAEAGVDAEAVAAAARHAAERETPWARDLAVMVTSDFQESPPWNETLGPVRPRGGPNGLVLRGGRIIAEWGDTQQADLTFSVAKSYLSILAGLAWDRGLIRDPHEEIRRTVDDGGFDPPHNDTITWHHLLQQTSEWEGMLWDKPDLRRSQPDRRRPPECCTQGNAPRAPAAGRVLGIQRRQGQPPEPRSVAALAPSTARGIS
jgi:CubicO group peptidase (beta-lactamase class C family)